MRKPIIAFFLFAALILSGSPSRAALLFSQPPRLGVERFPSSGDSPTADDFVAGGNWLVDSVEVTGVWYLNKEALGTDDSARPFRVEFYSDSGGLPASSPIAQFNATVPLVNLVQGATELFVGIYDIGVSFPSAVPLAAGQTYWFSIADTGVGSDISPFILTTSFDGNDKIAQRDSTHPWYLYYDVNDVAFNLFGSVVPEPPTLGMLACSAVGLIARRRRK